MEFSTFQYNLEKHNTLFTFSGTPNKVPQNSRKPLKRQLSRKLSFQTAGNVAKWSGRAKLRHQKSLLAESMIANKPVDLKIEAKLKSVLFQLMTNKVNLAQVEVKNLRASWTQTKENKEITAKLIDFIITDETSGFTSYKKIAECKGKYLLQFYLYNFIIIITFLLQVIVFLMPKLCYLIMTISANPKI